MLKFLQLRFLPTSVNLALLVLRVWFALPLLTLHGWSKLTGFAERSQRFADPFGSARRPAWRWWCLPRCSARCCSSWASAPVCGDGVRHRDGHRLRLRARRRLSGQGNGELPFMFLGAFVTLLLAGGGRFSVDARTGAR